MSEHNTKDLSRGFVFAATGDVYVTLARRAARSLRLVQPDAAIDLFTDEMLDDPVFDEVHLLSERWFRPKMESLIHSRFERTMYLDADIMVVANLTPAFDLLDAYDIAGVQDRRLNSPNAVRLHIQKLPSAFPQINGGMLVVRKSKGTQTFLKAWRSEMHRTKAKTDQPILRELLYNTELRFCALPPNYNLLTFNELKSWWGYFGAPRVLHSPSLYKSSQSDPHAPFTMEEVVGRLNAYRMRKLIHADYELTPDVPNRSRNMYSPIRTGLKGIFKGVVQSGKRLLGRS